MSRPTRPSILVCDVDTMFREVFASYARASGCDVEEVVDGQAALDVLASAAPAAMVIELATVGTVDGRQVLKRVRHARRQGEMRVVVTASGACGSASEILYKPIPPGALLRQLLGARLEPASPLCVFVVEDHQDSRDLLVEALAVCGIHAFGFSSGTAALAGLRAVRPCAIVTDYSLSDLDGAELARRARAVAPGVPVIVVTGHAHVVAGGRGFDRAFLKPYDVDDVVRAVGEVAANVPSD